MSTRHDRSFRRYFDTPVPIASPPTLVQVRRVKPVKRGCHEPCILQRSESEVMFFHAGPSCEQQTVNNRERPKLVRDTFETGDGEDAMGHQTFECSIVWALCLMLGRPSSMVFHRMGSMSHVREALSSKWDLTDSKVPSDSRRLRMFHFCTENKRYSKYGAEDCDVT